MATNIPSTIKQGKYTLHIELNANGQPVLRTLKQVSNYRIHYESKGYLTSKGAPKAIKTVNGINYYATYRTKSPLPLNEREVMISKMEDKMAGVGAISTSPTENPYCRKQALGSCKTKGKMKDVSICRMCYSMGGLLPGKGGKPAAKESARAGLVRNSRLLSQQIIENVPKITAPFFRFSAEGELINETHFINLVKIASSNKGTHFTLWTKRPDIVIAALQNWRISKPSNLYLIRSSPMLNKEAPLPPGFDKVFTVYTPDFVQKNHIKINCGAKSCMGCQICYTRNSIVYVKEQVKPNSRLIGKTP